MSVCRSNTDFSSSNTWAGINSFEMLLDENRATKGTLCELALRVTIGVDRHRSSLLLDAYKHFGEQEAFELLPRVPVPTDTQRAVKSQSTESEIR